MTKEKAVEILKQRKCCRECVANCTCEECDKAFDMAIKLLEQEPAIDKIRAEIEAIIGEHNLDDYDFCSGLICARNIIDKYKAESEVSE